MRSEAARWAASYETEGRFPEPALRPVPPGTSVFTHGGPDLVLEAPRWRLYSVRDVVSAVRIALERHDRARVAADVEEAIAVHGWGALDLLAGHIAPTTIPVVSRRVETLLAAWDALDTVGYVDVDTTPLPLVGLAELHLGGIVEMWTPQRGNDLRADLEAAVAAMRAASADEVRRRVLASLAATAAREPRLQRPERFADAGWLERAVATLLPEQYDAMTAGDRTLVLRACFILDELER